MHVIEAEGASTAEAIGLHRHEITLHIAQAMQQSLDSPEGHDVSPTPSGWHDELHTHLDYLMGSLVAETPEPFADYLTWLYRLRKTQGYSTRPIILALELLNKELHTRLTTDQWSTVSEVLLHGLNALKSSGNSTIGFSTAEAPGAVSDNALEPLVESLILGDHAQALERFRYLAGERHYTATALEIIQPAMYRIGQLWYERRISVAQEHLATALAQQLLARLFAETVPASTMEHRALFACVEGNHHALGLQMITDAFEIAGWQTQCLGADIPSHALVEHIDSTHPQLVGLSISLVSQLPTLKHTVQHIRDRLGQGQPRLIAGGLGLQRTPQICRSLGIHAYYPDLGAVLHETQ